MIDTIINDEYINPNYHYTLTHRIISPLTPKTYSVPVHGMNGSLDYTEVFGDIVYEDRRIDMEFNCEAIDFNILKRFDFESYAGKLVRLSFSDMNHLYFEGRFYVDSFEQEGTHWKITCHCIAKPIPIEK